MNDTEVEVYYYIECGFKTDDQWYRASTRTFDSLGAARLGQAAFAQAWPPVDWKYRIVKTTVISEVVP